MGRSRDLTIAGVALAVALLAAVAIVVLGTTHRTGAASSASAGEVIYRTGTFDGRPVPRTGGLGGGMMSGGGMMARGGCATCHGIDGRRRMTPTFTAPNITYSNLTDPKGMVAPDGSRGPTYSDAGIRTAVTQGLDPTGARLAAPMPQWQLTGQEWTDLLAYLKTLH